MLLLYALSFALQVNTIRVEATAFLFCVAKSEIRLPAAPSDGSSVRTVFPFSSCSRLRGSFSLLFVWPVCIQLLCIP